LIGSFFIVKKEKRTHNP